MNDKLKRIKYLFKIIGYFLLMFLVSLLFTLALANALSNLKIINLNLALICALISSILSAVIFTIIHYSNKKKTQKNVLKVFNFIKYYIIYMIIMDLAVSVKSDIEITIEEAKNIINLEITLFAILTALVVTWCVITERECGKNKENINPFGIEERKNKIINDFSNKNSAYNYFWDIIPFCISLIIISITITDVYINKKLSIVTQTFIYYNLHLLLYSMTIIVTDILFPTIAKLYIKKNQIINDKLYEDEIILGAMEDELLKIITEKYDTSTLTIESKKEMVKKVIKDMGNSANIVEKNNNMSEESNKKED